MEKNCRSFRNFYRLHSDAAAAQMLIVHFACREKYSNVSQGGEKKVVVSTRQKEEEEKKHSTVAHSVSSKTAVCEAGYEMEVLFLWGAN